MADLDQLTSMFRAFARSCLPRAPLYARLAGGVADDPELAALMLSAPPEQHNPTLLLCAVHDLVLRGESAALAAFYPNITAEPATGDPVPLFREVAMDHADQLREMLATRRTQTNEIGRCATLLPPLGQLAAARGPLSMVDVGTSAGLNQRLAHYSYRFDPDRGRHGRPAVAASVVGEPSSVSLVCGTRGPVPVPSEIPALAATVGLDSAPIDVDDEDGVRWLEACVWPDQVDRFARLQAAIAIARADPPTIRVGDAVEGVVAAIESVDGLGHPVITTTWVMNYLGEAHRRAFVAALDGYGGTRDLSWITAESPALTAGLPASAASPDEHDTVLSLTTWRQGERRVSRLGVAHPHGYWLHWQAPTDEANRPPW